MLGCLLAGYVIHSSYKFGVEAKFVQHARMLATHRTIHNLSTRSQGYRPCSPHCDGAVNDRQLGIENRDVTGRFTHKVRDFKRVANVQNIDLPDWRHGRDINANSVVMLGSELEEGLPDLSEPNNDNLIVCSHCF